MSNIDSNTTAQQFESVIRSKLECCKRLIELQNQQQMLLVDGRWADLAENVRSNDIVISRLARLEEWEHKLLERMQTNGEASCKNEAIEAEIHGLLMQLQDIVRINAELLQTASGFVDFTIEAIARAASADQSGGSAKAFMLDTEA